MGQHHARGIRRRAPIVLSLALLAGAALLAAALPASAAWPSPPATTTTTAATTTTTTPAPSCGAARTKADGSAWSCTFADEFSGTTLDRTSWVPQQTMYSGYTSGTECFRDSTNNVSVSGGVLRLTARKESSTITCYPGFSTRYTSGMVSTYGRFAQAYGRFEVRAKFPSTAIRGLQEALWLWPDDASRYGSSWPASGEIDIAEVYSQWNDRAIPYVHYNADGDDPNVTNTRCFIQDVSAFHTYAVEWTPTSIKVIYDGTTCLVDVWSPAAPLVAPQPFDQPFIVALTQGFGIGTNAPSSSTPLPAVTQVDYVHVWK
jgi:beta-glucanase (GH16 family)